MQLAVGCVWGKEVRGWVGGGQGGGGVASEIAVASAAPATPILAPKMSRGSRTRLSAFEARDTLW
jgi:hypothetical protein